MRSIPISLIIIIFLATIAPNVSMASSSTTSERISSSSSSESEEELFISLKVFVKKMIQENAYFSNLHAKDQKFQLNPQFLEKKSINTKMRRKLVKWMDELCEDFEFKPETFFLSVSILDQYLHLSEVTPKQLQLVGASVIYISAKIFETKLVTPSSYAYSAGDTFTAADLLQKEKQILSVLGFRTDFPIAMKYLKHLGMELSEDELDDCVELLTVLDESVDNYKYSRLELAEFVVILVKTGKVAGISLDQLVQEAQRLDKLFD